MSTSNPSFQQPPPKPWETSNAEAGPSSSLAQQQQQTNNDMPTTMTMNGPPDLPDRPGDMVGGMFSSFSALLYCHNSLTTFLSPTSSTHRLSERLVFLLRIPNESHVDGNVQLVWRCRRVRWWNRRRIWRRDRRVWRWDWGLRRWGDVWEWRVWWWRLWVS